MANTSQTLNDKLCFHENSNGENTEGGRRQSLICGLLNVDVHEAVSKTESAFKFAVEKIIHLTSILTSSGMFGFGMSQTKPQTNEPIYPRFLSTYYHIRNQLPHYFGKDLTFSNDVLWRLRNDGVMPIFNRDAYQEQPVWPNHNHSSHYPAASTKSHAASDDNEEFRKGGKSLTNRTENKMSSIGWTSSMIPKSISQNPQQNDEVKYPLFLKTFRKDHLPSFLSMGSSSREDYNVLKRRHSEVPTSGKHMS